MATDEKHLNRCQECRAACCQHVALEIDTPDCKQDYDNIRWFLLHKGVKVFCDFDDEWHVEFEAPCSKLNDDYSCNFYEKRPEICRAYPGDHEECEFENDEQVYKLLFTSCEEFEQYLAEQGIKWQYKKHKIT